MKTVLKHIVARTYKPLLEKYLSKTRVYQYEDIQLEIAPEVFHPGFFFSTRLLLKYIKKLPLKGKYFFEPGCGSGLISIYAAKKGAIVTASDINPVAIKFLRINSLRNDIRLNIVQSDLFSDVPPQQFDIIAINPPYYKKQPKSFRDYAWHCGENGEYFEKLFHSLKDYIHPQSEIYMVLFDGCDMEMISGIATINEFRLQCMLTHENLLEKNFILKIVRNDS
jgi:release factor glutamine methyltransferase